MQRGKLYGSSDRAVLWMPGDLEPWKIDATLTTKKVIENAGGTFLDRLHWKFLIAKERPDCYFCKGCDVFLVKPLR